MCGLLGVISKQTGADLECDHLEPLQEGLQQMCYRGPDHAGWWNDERVFLGHRRLSIIGLSPDGHQPFQYHETGLTVVYNGEIYNHAALRKKLEAAGYHFKSQSDTEVLLAAYNAYGEAFVHELRGMFAFVLYDRPNKKVIFGRDRLGKKPLYLYEDDRHIIFSSELKYFHRFPGASLQINGSSLLNFLSLQYVPGEETIYTRVRSIAPGSMYTYSLENGSGETTCYWRPSDLIGTRSETLRVEEVDKALQEAVDYRLVADVPVGLLLSGGIDSSLLACYLAARQQGGTLAFNVGFEDRRFDESGYAAQVAKALGIRLHTLEVGNITPEVFIRSVYHADQPLGDAAMIPTYLISEAISKQVKVVISGEGADELFHGYDHYQLEKWYYRLGPAVFTMLQAGASWLPPRYEKWKRKLRSIQGFRQDVGSCRWHSVLNPDALRGLLKNADELESFEPKYHKRLAGFRQLVPTYPASLLMDLFTWLPDDLLVKVDRMTMAHSVEGRAPFLDHELVELMLGCAGQFARAPYQSKNLLRQLLLKKLPAGISQQIAGRKKQGFNTPNDAWMKKDLRALADMHFSESRLREVEWLNAQAVKKQWEWFISGSPRANTRLTWNLLCYLEWERQHRQGFSQTKALKTVSAAGI